MFKFLLILWFTAATGFGGPLLIDTPIPVTGGGTSVRDLFGGGVDEYFSGSNGVDSVSFRGGGLLGPQGGIGYGSSGSQFTDNGAAPPGARIDDVYSHFFGFGIGGDGGSSLTLYDSAHNVIASAALIGYVTGYVSSNLGGGVTQTTFAIVSNPEPSSAWLVGLGFAALVIGLRLRPFNRA